jgi:hypothetical protein
MRLGSQRLGRKGRATRPLLAEPDPDVDSHQRSRMPAPKISAPESATIASVAPSKAINA